MNEPGRNLETRAIRVSPPLRVHPIPALALIMKRIFALAEPPAGCESSPTRGARATWTILRDDPQLVVAEGPEPGHDVVLQVDTGVTEQIEGRASDRLPAPHVLDHVPRSQVLRARALYPAEPDHMKVRREVPLEPVVTAIVVIFQLLPVHLAYLRSSSCGSDKTSL